MNKAHWSIERIDHHRKIIFIFDENDGSRTITNSAEQVTSEVFDGVNLPEDVLTYRLFYYDTDGNWDELMHDRGQFIDFAPGMGVRP